MARKRDTETINLFGGEFEDNEVAVTARRVKDGADSAYTRAADRVINPDRSQDRQIVFDIDQISSEEEDDELIIQSTSVSLRPFQEEAIKKTLWDLSEQNPDRVNSTLLVMATGCGKTFTTCQLINKIKEGKRFLIVCAQDELIWQWQLTLRMLGITGHVEKAGLKAADTLGQTDDTVVIASLQTIAQEERLNRYWDKDYFDVIIHDECDLCAGPTWRKLIEYFKSAKHIGLTATPDRLDGQNIGNIFEKCSFEYSLADAIKEGYLVMPRFKEAAHSDIDLNQLRFTAGDFNKGDLDQIVSTNVDVIANASRDLIEDRQTLAFCPTVASAHALAEALCQVGISAIAVSGRSKERKQIIADFKDGRYQVLCNAQLIARGVDIPIVSCIINARPTASRAFFSQMIGRGLRLFPGKEDCIIIDFAWKFQNNRHKLVKAVDLFDDSKRYSKKTMERAREIMDKKKIENAQDALQMAEDELKAELRNRLKVRKRDVNARITSYDAIILDVLQIPRRRSVAMGAEPASGKQKNFLVNRFKVKVDQVEGMTKIEASQMISSLKNRSEQEKATWPQVQALIREGVDIDEARDFSFTEARAYLDAAYGSKRRTTNGTPRN